MLCYKFIYLCDVLGDYKSLRAWLKGWGKFWKGFHFCNKKPAWTTAQSHHFFLLSLFCRTGTWHLRTHTYGQRDWNAAMSTVGQLQSAQSTWKQPQNHTTYSHTIHLETAPETTLRTVIHSTVSKCGTDNCIPWICAGWSCSVQVLQLFSL